MCSKSANYCFATRAKNEGLVLLSEVSCVYINMLHCFVIVVVCIFLSPIYGNNLNKCAIHPLECLGFILHFGICKMLFSMCCFVNNIIPKGDSIAVLVNFFMI